MFFGSNYHTLYHSAQRDGIIKINARLVEWVTLSVWEVEEIRHYVARRKDKINEVKSTK